MAIDTSYIENVIAKTQSVQDDVDGVTRLHAGKNLYEHAVAPQELVISSIVAREDIPDDLLLYIHHMYSGGSYEKTLKIYNQLIVDTKKKVEKIKNEIQDDYIKHILNEIEI